MITSNLRAESFAQFLKALKCRTMGAVVCIEVSQRGTPRDTPGMQMSWYGDSFRVHDSSSVDLFCLATENQGQFLRHRAADDGKRQHAAACGAGLRIDHVGLIKQKFRSYSRENLPSTGGLHCRKAACSHNHLCVDVSCADPSMLRAVNLKHLKPLPPYIVQSNQSK